MILKEIEGFPEYYITDDWKCYSEKVDRIIGSDEGDGHIHLGIYNEMGKRSTRLHVIIAEMFKPIPERYKDVPREEMVVHHIDFNPYNNEPSNLQWMTKKEHDELHNNSDVTRKRISEKNKGRKLTEEQCREISERQRGNKNHFFGKHLSGVHRKKISEANINNPLNSKKVVQIDITTNEIIAVYPSAAEASRQTGINYKGICLCCSGKRNSAGGYKWRYAD